MEGGVQLPLFPNMLAETVKHQSEETITVSEHKRKKKHTHDDWMSALPIDEVEHREEHSVCENCGAEMKEIGKDTAYDELVYTPAKYHIRRHIVYTYNAQTVARTQKMTRIMQMTLSTAISVVHSIRSR